MIARCSVDTLGFGLASSRRKIPQIETKGLKLNVSDSNLSVVICSVMEKSGEALAAGLLDAQIKAKALFAEIQAQGLIRVLPN